MIELHHGAYHDVADARVFFPPPGDVAAEMEAKRICAQCPIRLECLAVAQRTQHLQGIWGGRTAAERALPDRPR